MSVRILLGDVREKLAELPDESVHCIVTSPPYFGLRDYGTASWEGGDSDCSHLQPATGSTQNKGNNGKNGTPYRDLCGKCGATRTDKQIGLEPTPAEFVQVMVDVFREVRRVLRKDGTLWLNLGDSYAGSNQTGGTNSKETGRREERMIASRNTGAVPAGLKHKDLMGIPWRVAFALQADGWYLRQDIIWSKPNPMPESVTDRCTKAHEYLFLLSKSARYHYDAEAIAEEALGAGAPIKMADGWDTGPGGHGTVHREGREKGASNGAVQASNRNRRSVWTVATQPFKEAHFATFPPDLIEPCIKAGCPKDCCAKCGAPVGREVEKTFAPLADRQVHRGKGGDKGLASNGWDVPRGTTTATTLGWSPSCSCDAGLVRGTVLDPFGGAGTTGLVADRLQRDAILIELNPAYAEIARERIKADSSMFAEVA